MSSSLPSPTLPVSCEPRILVVDDDKRVLELLEIAFSNQGFRVLMASDGDEAIRHAAHEKPDLIILDVRLPRRSGLDVCELLRRDAPDGVPIVMVSAAVETETRLQAFARGADDFLPKPFSPKELVARVRRLLARTAETREARRRMRDLERELGRAQENAQRAHHDATRELRLRRLAAGPGQALHRSLDADEIVERLLFDAHARLGSGFVALLWSAEPGEPLRAWAARGESLDRVAALEISRAGSLAELIEGLGRPVLRRELERFPELRAELPAYLAHGVTVLAPVAGDAGLEALLVADERADGGEPSAGDLELLASLCEIASVAMRNAARVRRQTLAMIETILGAPAERDDVLLDEASRLAARVGQVTLLPPRQRTLVEMALRLGPMREGTDEHETLLALVAEDATGLIRDLLAIERRAESLEPADEHWLPEESRAPLLLSLVRGWLTARREGCEPDASAVRACAAAGIALDATTARALRDAQAEAGRMRVTQD